MQELKFKWMDGYDTGSGIDCEYWWQIFLNDFGMILVCKFFDRCERKVVHPYVTQWKFEHMLQKILGLNNQFIKSLIW